jgi:hypothetical protein
VKASKVFFLIFLMMFLCVVNTRPVKATEDSWATMAEMPTARSGLGVAAVNGKIYAIGGMNGGHLNTNEEYDPATNTWATKKPMPTPRSRFGIAVYQNKIYVIGGERYGGYTGANEVYDPLTDTWETKTPMPTVRADLCANTVNGKIHLISGNQIPLGWPEPSNVNEVYDPATDSWTTKAPMPTATYGCVSAVVNNKIYVIESSSWVGGSGLNQIYDAETNTWSYGKNMPTALDDEGAAGATTGVMAPKRIYVMGSQTYGSVIYYNLNQVYDPEGDTWTTGTPMPTARQSLGIAVVNDVLYAIGGYGGDNYRNENEQYTPFGFGTVPQQSEPQQSESFPTTWIVAAIVIIAVVGVALLVYFAKVKKTTEKAETQFVRE